jgi:hypothetical protein
MIEFNDDMTLFLNGESEGQSQNGHEWLFAVIIIDLTIVLPQLPELIDIFDMIMMEDASDFVADE